MSPLRALARPALVAIAFASCSAGGGNPVPYAPSGDTPPNDAPPPASGPSDDRSTYAANANAAAPTAAPTSSAPPAPPPWDGTPYYDADAHACITTLDDARDPCEARYDAMTAAPHGKLGPSETTGYGQCGVYFTWYDYTTDDVRRCFYSVSVKLLVGWQRWAAVPSYCGGSQLLQAGEVPDGCGPPQTPALP